MPIPETYNSKEPQSARDRIYEQLKTWIIEGQLEPLEKISDVEIGRYFNVSRTPVREALQQLENQKLIKSFPGKATIVTDINLEGDGIEQLYLPMMALQELAVRIAVEHSTEDDISMLTRLNDRFVFETTLENNALNILNADYEFHSYILELADYEYIHDFCDTLWLHIQRLDYTYFRDEKTFSSSIDTHNAIIAAFKTKDADAAASAMRDNWRNYTKIKGI
ncbi:MAG: GntR family transcriptional regulator [Lentihominibacter sp.]|jgi:DNA-binding GntR family transcriptional regulator